MYIQASATFVQCFHFTQPSSKNSTDSGKNLKLVIFLFVVFSRKRELTIGCTPNSFLQFSVQGKTTNKGYVIYSLSAVSTLWNEEPIFIPRLRARDHECF